MAEKVRVKYKKLGRQQVHGLAHDTGLIEIDSRLTGFKELKIHIHERIHTLNWDMPESDVAKLSYHIARMLWTDLKYRRLK